MNSHLEDGCPQVISDVFIRMGMNGLSSLMEKVLLYLYKKIYGLCMHLNYL